MATRKPEAAQPQPVSPGMQAFIDCLRAQRTTALDACAEYVGQLADLNAQLAARDEEIKALKAKREPKPEAALEPKA